MDKQHRVQTNFCWVVSLDTLILIFDVLGCTLIIPGVPMSPYRPLQPLSPFSPCRKHSHQLRSQPVMCGCVIIHFCESHSDWVNPSCSNQRWAVLSVTFWPGGPMAPCTPGSPSGPFPPGWPWNTHAAEVNCALNIYLKKNTAAWMCARLTSGPLAPLQPWKHEQQ